MRLFVLDNILLSPPPNFPENSTFIHVSRLALVDSVLLLLMPGSHPNRR